MMLRDYHSIYGNITPKICQPYLCRNSTNNSTNQSMIEIWQNSGITKSQIVPDSGHSTGGSCLLRPWFFSLTPRQPPGLWDGCCAKENTRTRKNKKERYLRPLRSDPRPLPATCNILKRKIVQRLYTGVHRSLETVINHSQWTKVNAKRKGPSYVYYRKTTAVTTGPPFFLLSQTPTIQMPQQWACL